MTSPHAGSRRPGRTSVRSALTSPQPEQVFEDGNQRSATTSSVPYQAALYVELAAELPERGVGDDPGQPAVGEHPGRVEVLDDHRRVAAGELGGDLVEQVAAQVRDPGVDLAQASCCLLPAVGVPLGSRERLVGQFQACLGVLECFHPLDACSTVRVRPRRPRGSSPRGRHPPGPGDGSGVRRRWWCSWAATPVIGDDPAAALEPERRRVGVEPAGLEHLRAAGGCSPGRGARRAWGTASPAVRSAAPTGSRPPWTSTGAGTPARSCAGT